jgi:hypothetical protein
VASFVLYNVATVTNAKRLSERKRVEMVEREDETAAARTLALSRKLDVSNSYDGNATLQVVLFTASLQCFTGSPVPPPPCCLACSTLHYLGGSYLVMFSSCLKLAFSAVALGALQVNAAGDPPLTVGNRTIERVSYIYALRFIFEGVADLWSYD